MTRQAPYPDFMRALPQADMPGPVKGYLLTGQTSQALFLEIPAGNRVPPHSHAAQWGLVIEGEVEFTIGELTQIFKAGDSYDIPAQVVHSAHMLTHCRLMEVFADPKRWLPKEG